MEQDEKEFEFNIEIDGEQFMIFKTKVNPDGTREVIIPDETE